MTAPHIRLAAADAAEFTELLNFLIEWINHDRTQLPASLRRFTGHDPYGTATLRADLACFQFLLRRRRAADARHQRRLTPVWQTSPV